MKVSDRIAIGWSAIGDLNKLCPNNQSEITKIITKEYNDLDNANLGGPSLWNLYSRMNVGDFVILNANGKRKCVFEVTGPYIFDRGKGNILGYSHQRPACLTDIDPEELWNKSGSAVAEGQNIRWTLAACFISEKAKKAIYTEGARLSVISTAIERNPFARKKCLDHYGYKCTICTYDFEENFGALGEGFIHVHHHVDIATKNAIHKVDPIKDLIPLCPNCHAMAHRKKPAIAVRILKDIYAKNTKA